MEQQNQRREYRMVRLYDDPATGKQEMEYFASLCEFRPGASVAESHYLHYNLMLARVALFWIRLSALIDCSLCGLRAFQGIPFMFAPDHEGSRFYTWKDVLRPFGFRKQDIADDIKHSPGLFEGWRHERLAQLSEAVKVTEFQSTRDFRLILDRLRSGAPRSDSKLAKVSGKREELEERMRKNTAHFYRCIVPLAFATLWFWKAWVRDEKNYERDREEVCVLWRALLQLFAVAETPFEQSVVRVNPRRLESLFKGDVAHTAPLVIDKPVLDMSQSELWRTWSALVWRSPGLLPDPEEYDRLVRALTLRTALLTSTADTQDVFDCPRYVKIPDSEVTSASPLGHANELFVADTERLVTVLLDNLFAIRYFMLTSAEPADSESHARCFEESESTTERRWLKVCRDTLAGRSGVFVREILPKRGWERYGYWGEVERHRERIKNPTVGARHAMADFRKGHTDIVSNILQGSYATETIWDRAAAARQVERRAMQEEGCRGWSFRLLWDYHEEIVERRGTSQKEAAFANIRVHVDPVTEKVTYIEKRSGNVIHGDRFRALELLRARTEISGGTVEANLLEDVALEIILNAEKRARSRCLALDFVYTQSPDTALALRHLIGRGSENGFVEHDLQDSIGRGEFCIVSHLHRYAVYNGHTHNTLVYTPQLSVALQTWAEHVEREQIVPKLDALVARVREIPEPDADDAETIILNAARIGAILQTVYDLVALIPPTLRKVTRLNRDPLLGRALATRYDPDDHESEYNTAAVIPSEWDSPAFLVDLKRRAPTLPALREAALEERLHRHHGMHGRDNEEAEREEGEEEHSDDVPWDLTDAIHIHAGEIMDWQS